MPAIPDMATVWDPLGKAQAAIIGGADPTSTTAAAAKTISSQIKYHRTSPPGRPLPSAAGPAVRPSD